MIEHQLWHPVIASHQVRHEPVACSLLGQQIVLWREHTHEGARVHAWADRCPHRGARLSLGRVLIGVHGARLECPYHGWQFAAADGRCQHIPAAPDFVPPPAHRTTAFDAREQHGLVWVRLQPPTQSLSAELAEPPAFAQSDDATWRTVLCGPYELNTSAPRLVENFLDLSHFGFVHEGWLGERSHAQVQTGAVEEGTGLAGLVVRDARAWQPRAYAGADEGSWIAYRYDVPHPYAAILRKDATQGDPVSNAIALFIRPDGHELCTAWFVMATQGDTSSDQELVAFQDAVFAQDRPVVESQSPRALPVGRTVPVAEVHGPADRVSSAYRRYLNRLGVALGIC